MNQNDQLFQETARKIAKSVSSKFKFGSYEREDIEQEVYILCVNGLERYNEKQPLENFLWTHVKNRLCNLKRNKYERKESPCLKCPLYDKLKQVNESQCKRFEDKSDCDLYQNWIYRNEAKKTLASAAMPGAEALSNYSQDMSNTRIETKEMMDIIDRDLPAEYRATYIKYKYGAKLKDEETKQLLGVLRAILEKRGIFDVE